jgi:hypothetical protein
MKWHRLCCCSQQVDPDAAATSPRKQPAVVVQHSTPHPSPHMQRLEQWYGVIAHHDHDVWVEKSYTSAKLQTVLYYHNVRTGTRQLWEPPTGATHIVREGAPTAHLPEHVQRVVALPFHVDDFAHMHMPQPSKHLQEQLQRRKRTWSFRPLNPYIIRRTRISDNCRRTRADTV